MRPLATWILNLEHTEHIVEYLIVIWPGGKVEFEDSYSMDSFHPKDGVTLDDRAGFLQEFVVECQGEDAEVLCTYTRQIKLEREIVKQIFRANGRGFYRDNSRLPYWDSQRSRLDLLATVIDKALEKLFWAEWVEFMVVRPSRRLDQSIPQTRCPPTNSEINLTSPADSERRF